MEGQLGSHHCTKRDYVNNWEPLDTVFYGLMFTILLMDKQHWRTCDTFQSWSQFAVESYLESGLFSTEHLCPTGVPFACLFLVSYVFCSEKYMV